jgi:hypothetical protein
VDENIVPLDLVINRSKRATLARSSYTFPGLYYEQRPVIGALNQGATAIKELIFHPFETRADVRARIVVEIQTALVVNGEERAIR